MFYYSAFNFQYLGHFHRHFSFETSSLSTGMIERNLCRANSEPDRYRLWTVVNETKRGLESELKPTAILVLEE